MNAARRAPAAIGDDVLVELVVEDGAPPVALLKELVRRSAGFVELRQFTPDRTIRLATSRIAALHRVTGEAY